MEHNTTIAPESAAALGKGETCTICGNVRTSTFFELQNVPVLCNAPCNTRNDALHFPTGEIRLAFCQECGHIFNQAFNPHLARYSCEYDNSLHFSSRFQAYIEWLATDLVSRFDLYDKDLVEIGCGKGDFLALLCRRGGNRGIGFDPTFEPDRLDSSSSEQVKVIREFYSEAYGELACDFLCCRQTLEHIPEPSAFLEGVRRALGNRTHASVFFEVPNALYTVRHNGIWDIIYEHVSYFWSVPLSRLFADNGFAVALTREVYDGQFLCIEAQPSDASHTHIQTDERELEQVTREVRLFADTYLATIAATRSKLQLIQDAGERAVIWGAGSKGVTLLNLFREFTCLEYAVDINPSKQHKFVAGTGHKIVAPDFLRSYRPDVIFLTNAIYLDEVEKTLSSLSLNPSIVTV